MARLAHRRIPNDGQITALVAHLFSGPHCGHALQGEHPPSSSVANGAEASPEAFDSILPPRDVASEDGMFCPHIPKLDSSAPCFIQSRTLVYCLGGISRMGLLRRGQQAVLWSRRHDAAYEGRSVRRKKAKAYGFLFVHLIARLSVFS